MITLLAGIVAVYDFILFGTLLPEISASFGWSTPFALLMSTLVSVGTAVVLFAVAPLVDRIGRRKGMIVTVTGTAFASAGTALTAGAASLVPVRSLSGLSLSEQSVAATYLNELYGASDDEWIKRNRGFVFSMVQASWPLGALSAAGFVALTMLFLEPDQWRMMFLIATVPALLTVVLLRRMKETPQFRTHRLQVTRSASQRGASFRAIFRGGHLRNTVVLSVAWVTNWFAIQTFSVLGTTVLQNGKDVSAANSLLLLVVSNLVAVLGYLAHGWMGDRFGRHRVIVVGWLIGGLVFAAMLLGPTNTVFVIVTYMAGLFFLLGPYAALMFFQAECYTVDCRATGGTFIYAMSQPGSIIGGLLLSVLTAASWDYNHVALAVGAGGCLISGLVMLGAKAAPATPAESSS